MKRKFNIFSQFCQMNLNCLPQYSLNFGVDLKLHSLSIKTLFNLYCS